MAQLTFDNRYKHSKVIPISVPTSRKSTMMTNNASLPKADRKDRQQQQAQQGDTASVASTVKISNVATSSPVHKRIPMDDHRSMIASTVRPSNIKSILDNSSDDTDLGGNNINIYKRANGYHRDSLMASTTNTIARDDDSSIVYKGRLNHSYGR